MVRMDERCHAHEGVFGSLTGPTPTSLAPEAKAGLLDGGSDCPPRRDLFGVIRKTVPSWLRPVEHTRKKRKNWPAEEVSAKM